MNATNNNNKKTQAKKESKQRKSCKRCQNPFRLDILDDFYDPFDKDIFGFDNMEDRMFRNFRNIFTDFGLLSEPKVEEKKEEEKPKEEKPEEIKPVEPVEDVKMEEEKEEEINTDSKKEEPKEEENKMEEEKEEEINTDSKKEEPKKEEPKKEEPKKEEPKKEEPKKEENKKPSNEGTYYSKVYYRTYNNIDGEPHEESYTSQSVKQTNDGHDISEAKEAYKNSDGVQKTAYQRGLDGKTTRFIKENNVKTGKHNQKKVIKGIEEDGIKDFNKEYDDYCKKCGFRKNFHKLGLFDPFGFGTKQLTDGNTPIFFHKLLF